MEEEEEAEEAHDKREDYEDDEKDEQSEEKDDDDGNIGDNWLGKREEVEGWGERKMALRIKKEKIAQKL